MQNAKLTKLSVSDLNILFQCQPAILRPIDFLLNQDAGTILRHAVTMAEEEIAIREGVGRAMTHRLIFLLVTFQQQGATAIAHILAFSLSR